MASVERTGRRRKSRAKRPHNPEMLRMKRVARNLGISWGDVCKSRDALREAELETRRDHDDIRRAAWIMVAGEAAAPFWRGGFQRKFKKLLRDGGDCDQVSGWDEVCQQLRSVCPQCSEWASEEIWSFVCSDYPPLLSVDVHYRNAVALLTREILTDDVPF